MFHIALIGDARKSSGLSSLSFLDNDTPAQRAKLNERITASQNEVRHDKTAAANLPF